MVALFFLIVPSQGDIRNTFFRSLHDNIRNMFFDQRSPQPPEVGVSRWRRQTDGHGDFMTDPARRAESVKIQSDTKINNDFVCPETQ